MMPYLKPLDHNLIASYQSANYHVYATPPFTLNIGIASQCLKALYQSAHVKSACFLTAFNPHSQTLSEEENKLRNDQLISELKKHNLQLKTGIGLCPKSEWLGEESLLILGISLTVAKALGKKYGQNAIVWCDHDAVPQLVLLV